MVVSQKPHINWEDTKVSAGSQEGRLQATALTRLMEDHLITQTIRTPTLEKNILDPITNNKTLIHS